MWLRSEKIDKMITHMPASNPGY